MEIVEKEPILFSVLTNEPFFQVVYGKIVAVVYIIRFLVYQRTSVLPILIHTPKEKKIQCLPCIDLVSYHLPERWYHNWCQFFTFFVFAMRIIGVRHFCGAFEIEPF